MSISSYSELQTAVADWIHEDSLTTIIPDFIALAEKRIEREVRCSHNESALSVAMVSGVATLPTDYLELKYAYLDLTPVRVLERTTPRKIYERYPNRSTTGIPHLIATDAGQFIFGCQPASDYTVKGTYYAKLTSVATSWNDLATNYPDLYLFAALAETAPYMNDDARVQLWEMKYQKILSDLKAKEKRESLSGSPLVMRVA